MRHRRVADLLNRERLVQVEADTSVREACQVMTMAGVASLAVTRDGALLGLFGTRDAAEQVIAMGRDPDRTTLAEVVAKGAPSLPPDASAADAAAMMLDSRLQELPVLRGKRVVGLLSLRSLLAALADTEERAAKKATRGATR